MVQADIALVGLAVTGQNLALNIDDHGFRVAVFNHPRGVSTSITRHWAIAGNCCG
jgi:6-phosphogluconate dehydrogenase